MMASWVLRVLITPLHLCINLFYRHSSVANITSFVRAGGIINSIVLHFFFLISGVSCYSRLTVGDLVKLRNVFIYHFGALANR